MIEASIITIGDELLIGQVIDTNGAWMSQELNKAGIWVSRRVSVGDSWSGIWNCLDQELISADILLITGGLGPTADDITKPLLCKYFGGNLVVDPGALKNVKYIFETVLQRPMIDRNLRQAEVPDNCVVLQNSRGTAPGMWFEKDSKIIISLPGVPYEMKGLMTGEVIPRLAARFSLPAISHRTLLVAGIGESFLAEHIQGFEKSLPQHIKLAYLPNYGMLRLRLTARGNIKDQVEKELEIPFNKLRLAVQDWLVVDQDATMQEAIGQLLVSKKLTLVTAESCTGGTLAHLITSVPGSSQYFVGSVISYANRIKEKILGVKKETLDSFGAVSEQTVKEMAAGALRLLDADLVVATSGIMGPGGGKPGKPVGMVWIGVGDRHNIMAEKMQFRFDRQRNIDLTSTFALNLLRKFILNGGGESGPQIRKK